MEEMFTEKEIDFIKNDRESVIMQYILFLKYIKNEFKGLLLNAIWAIIFIVIFLLIILYDFWIKDKVI